MLDGIFSITDELNGVSKINYHSGFLMAEAMKFAVEKVIVRKPDNLRNS